MVCFLRLLLCNPCPKVLLPIAPLAFSYLRWQAPLLQPPDCTPQVEQAAQLPCHKESSKVAVVARSYTVPNYPARHAASRGCDPTGTVLSTPPLLLSAWRPPGLCWLLHPLWWQLVSGMGCARWCISKKGHRRFSTQSVSACYLLQLLYEEQIALLQPLLEAYMCWPAHPQWWSQCSCTAWQHRACISLMKPSVTCAHASLPGLSRTAGQSGAASCPGRLEGGSHGHSTAWKGKFNFPGGQVT
jgi:hypothetical protein